MITEVISYEDYREKSPATSPEVATSAAVVSHRVPRCGVRAVELSTLRNSGGTDHDCLSFRKVAAYNIDERENFDCSQRRRNLDARITHATDTPTSAPTPRGIPYLDSPKRNSHAALPSNRDHVVVEKALESSRRGHETRRENLNVSIPYTVNDVSSHTPNHTPSHPLTTTYAIDNVSAQQTNRTRDDLRECVVTHDRFTSATSPNSAPKTLSDHSPNHAPSHAPRKRDSLFDSGYGSGKSTSSREAASPVEPACLAVDQNPNHTDTPTISPSNDYVNIDQTTNSSTLPSSVPLVTSHIISYGCRKVFGPEKPLPTPNPTAAKPKVNSMESDTQTSDIPSNGTSSLNAPQNTQISLSPHASMVPESLSNTNDSTTDTSSYAIHEETPTSSLDDSSPSLDAPILPPTDTPPSRMVRINGQHAQVSSNPASNISAFISRKLSSVNLHNSANKKSFLPISNPVGVSDLPKESSTAFNKDIEKLNVINTDLKNEKNKKKSHSIPIVNNKSKKSKSNMNKKQTDIADAKLPIESNNDITVINNQSIIMDKQPIDDTLENDITESHDSVEITNIGPAIKLPEYERVKDTLLGRAFNRKRRQSRQKHTESNINSHSIDSKQLYIPSQAEDNCLENIDKISSNKNANDSSPKIIKSKSSACSSSAKTNIPGLEGQLRTDRRPKSNLPSYSQSIQSRRSIDKESVKKVPDFQLLHESPEKQPNSDEQQEIPAVSRVTSIKSVLVKQSLLRRKASTAAITKVVKPKKKEKSNKTEDIETESPIIPLPPSPIQSPNSPVCSDPCAVDKPIVNSPVSTLESNSCSDPTKVHQSVEKSTTRKSSSSVGFFKKPKEKLLQLGRNSQLKMPSLRMSKPEKSVGGVDEDIVLTGMKSITCESLSNPTSPSYKPICQTNFIPISPEESNIKTPKLLCKQTDNDMNEITVSNDKYSEQIEISNVDKIISNDIITPNEDSNTDKMKKIKDGHDEIGLDANSLIIGDKDTTTLPIEASSSISTGANSPEDNNMRNNQNKPNNEEALRLVDKIVIELQALHDKNNASDASKDVHVEDKAIDTKSTSRTPLTTPLATIINRIITLRENDSNNEMDCKTENINSTVSAIYNTENNEKIELENTKNESKMHTSSEPRLPSEMKSRNSTNSFKINPINTNTIMEGINVDSLTTNLKSSLMESFDSNCISESSTHSSNSVEDDNLLCNLGSKSSRRSSIKSSQEIQDHALSVMAKETIRAAIPILKSPKTTVPFEYPSREDVPAVTRMNTRMNAKSNSESSDKSSIISNKNGYTPQNSQDIPRTSKNIKKKSTTPINANNMLRYPSKSIQKPSTNKRSTLTNEEVPVKSSVVLNANNETPLSTNSSAKVTPVTSKAAVTSYKLKESRLSMPKTRKNHPSGLTSPNNDNKVTNKCISTKQSPCVDASISEKCFAVRKQRNSSTHSKIDKLDNVPTSPVKPIRKTKKIVKRSKGNGKLNVDKDKLLTDEVMKDDKEIITSPNKQAISPRLSNIPGSKDNENNTPSADIKHNNISPPMMKAIQKTSPSIQKTGLRHPLQRTPQRSPQRTPERTPQQTPRDSPLNSPIPSTQNKPNSKQRHKTNIQATEQQLPAQHLPLQQSEQHPIQQTHQHPTHNSSLRKKSSSKERQVDNVKPQIHRSLTRKHTIEKPELTDKNLDNESEDTSQCNENNTVCVSELTTNIDNHISPSMTNNEPTDVTPKCRTSIQNEPPTDNIILNPNISPNLSISNIPTSAIQSIPTPKSPQVNYTSTPPATTSPSRIKYIPNHPRTYQRRSSTPKSCANKSILSPNSSPIKYLPFAETKKPTSGSNLPASESSKTSRPSKTSETKATVDRSGLTINSSTQLQQLHNAKGNINELQLKQNQNVTSRLKPPSKLQRPWSSRQKVTV